MPRQLLLVVALAFAVRLPAQIVLNEVSPTNLGLVQDQDGDASDWLEIFNAGFDAVDLDGHGLSDGKNAAKWKFPAVSLDAGRQLLVFASGKDRRTLPVGTPNHWETAIFEGDDWQYFIGTEEPAAKWNQLGFNALANWTTGKGPFGYGDSDDSTTVPAGTLSFYFRKNFTVADASKLTRAILSFDYDDGFVAYLNGQEFARSANMPAGPTTYQTTANPDHEAHIYDGGQAETFVLDPAFLAANLKTGNNVLAIELHNINASSSDLSGRAWLHFGVADAQHFFSPNPSWFTADAGAGLELHTNFKLRAGETVKLFDPAGQILDSVSLKDLQPGHVRARISDGDSWCYSNEPTPGTANAGVCFKGYAPVPSIALASGFYSGGQTTSISGGGTIRFTTDGSEPNDSSEIYANSLTISQSSCLRARSFQGQRLPSAVASASYLIDEATTLPVVSIMVRPGDFFDDGSGGPAVYDFKKGKAGVRVEYFDAARNHVFSENASARVVGNYSVDFAQKGLQFEFSEDFGAAGEVPNIFKNDKPALGKLHGFRIRNMDDDASGCRMRDVITNRIANPTHCVTTGYDNAAVFINGQYWGHYTPREMENKWFVRDNFGADPATVDVITTQYLGSDAYFASEGTDDEFLAMSDFVIGQDMASATNWAKADSLLDWRNWADYFATEVYINNQDWFPSMYFNNTRLFRAAGVPWKYVLWDTNYSQGIGGGPETNLLDATLSNPAQQNRHTDMFNSLLANPIFKNYFINRFADLLNWQFNPLKIKALIDENAAQLEPEISANNDRWGSIDLGGWQGNVSNLKDWHDARVPFVRDHIQQHFALGGQSQVVLRAAPAGAGRIIISTIEPGPLPWTGVYFKGNPVKVTAIAEPGFVFAGWAANPFIVNPLESSFTANITSNTTFTANFSGSSAAAKLVVDEINYNSDTLLNSGDWFELFNAGDVELDLSNWSVEDDKPAHNWKIPVGTKLAAGGRLVLFSDDGRFKAVHGSVTNKLGPLGWGFSKNGDTIVVRNPAGAIHTLLKFNDKSPWPCTPDGFGRTLQLTNPDADPNLPESWFAGCIGGSPGVAYSPCNDFPVISEINYNSDSLTSASDWFEIWNSSASILNLGNYVVRDQSGLNFFKFPANALIPANGRLVLFSDEVKFLAQHPNVTNRLGPLGFTLSNMGDVIRLYDALGVLRNSVCFNDKAPWPIDADGNGKTLEFLGGQPNVGTNWIAGCPGGSPGVVYDPTCGMIPTHEVSPENLRLEVSPNPAGEVVFVKILGKAAGEKLGPVRAFDVLGRLVFSDNELGNGGSVSVGKLPAGVYRLVVGNWVGGFVKG